MATAITNNFLLLELTITAYFFYIQFSGLPRCSWHNKYPTKVFSYGLWSRQELVVNNIHTVKFLNTTFAIFEIQEVIVSLLGFQQISAK